MKKKVEFFENFWIENFFDANFMAKCIFGTMDVRNICSEPKFGKHMFGKFMFGTKINSG